jgi:hypothetical protein
VHRRRASGGHQLVVVLRVLAGTGAVVVLDQADVSERSRSA